MRSTRSQLDAIEACALGGMTVEETAVFLHRTAGHISRIGKLRGLTFAEPPPLLTPEQEIDVKTLMNLGGMSWRAAIALVLKPKAKVPPEMRISRVVRK
jgi:hypothetical protein